MQSDEVKIAWLEVLGVNALSKRAGSSTPAAAVDGSVAKSSIASKPARDAAAASGQAALSSPIEAGLAMANKAGTKATSDSTGDEKAAQKKIFEERRAAFKAARAAWVTTKAKAESDLEAVKDGARMQYLSDMEQFPKIEQGCRSIDAILDNLDDELRDTLDQYASTPLSNQTKLHRLASSASEVLDRYLSYVSNDPILKAIDEKEFADVTVYMPIMKALTQLRRALV